MKIKSILKANSLFILILYSFHDYKVNVMIFTCYIQGALGDEAAMQHYLHIFQPFPSFTHIYIHP